MNRVGWAVGLATTAAAAALLLPTLRDASRSEAESRVWRSRIRTVRPMEVARMVVDGADVVLLDIREPEEFEEFRIPGAELAPLREIRSMDLLRYREADLVVAYCVKDLRGIAGLKILERRGLENAAIFEGYGLSAWMDAGLPIAGVYAGLDEGEALAELRERVRGRVTSLQIE